MSGNARDGAIQVVIKIRLGKVERLAAIRRSQRDANGFECGRVALGGNTSDRDQHIGLRIVRGSAPAGDSIGNDGKTGRLPNFPFKVTEDIHDLTCLEISCFHIKRVQEEHPATTKDTPIAIIQSIDRGIELIVASNGSQEELVRLQAMVRDWANA
jgi:hypothetical protein